MKLDKNFFNNKNTLTLAKDLLGKILVHKTHKGIIKGIITETEAYTQEEESCHAFGGKITKKNNVMFKEAGHFYVYFTYGMHYCCNIVSEKEGRGCAVLIRSVIPYDDISEKIMIDNRNWKNKPLKELANGPAKLCQAYNFSIKENGINMALINSKIYIENLELKNKSIIQTTRIGISKAKDLEWRFILKEFKLK